MDGGGWVYAEDSEKYAKQLEKEIRQWKNLCNKLEHALRCANNSYVGSPEGQKQIDDALKAYSTTSLGTK